MGRESNRRGFLRTAAGGIVGLAVAERGAFSDRSTAATVAAPEDLPAGITRTWLAPAYWAKRSGFCVGSRLTRASRILSRNVRTRDVIAG